MNLKLLIGQAVELPPPDVLRKRLSSAMRDVDILSGLLKLSERVAKRDGGVLPTPTRDDRTTDQVMTDAR